MRFIKSSEKVKGCVYAYSASFTSAVYHPQSEKQGLENNLAYRTTDSETGEGETLPAPDDPFYQFLRYVERNALREGLGPPRRRLAVEKPVDSRAGSRRAEGAAFELACFPPTPLPREHVNAAPTKTELEALRRSVQRGAPYGSASWTASTAEELGLQATLRRARSTSQALAPQPLNWT